MSNSFNSGDTIENEDFGYILNKAKSCLHNHLGSACSAAILWELAHEQGINLGVKDFFEFEKLIYLQEKTDWEKYLAKFHLTQKIQSSPLAIEKSVYMAISSSYRKYGLENVELRFNPMLRNLNKYYDLDSIILRAIHGMEKATMVYPIKAGLILEVGRDFTEDQSIIIAQKALKYKDHGVVGFDLSGNYSNKGGELSTFIKAFEIAKAGGLGITCHGGETPGSAKELNEIITNFDPDRIGHGIRCVDDKYLLEIIAEKGICLEICPTSNIFTKCVDELEDFEEIFARLDYFGVKYTINTDGPIFLQTSVKKEFENLLFNGIIGEEQAERAIQNSFECSFNNNFRAQHISNKMTETVLGELESLKKRWISIHADALSDDFHQVRDSVQNDALKFLYNHKMFDTKENRGYFQLK